MTFPKIEGKISDLKKQHRYFNSTLLQNQIKFMEGNTAEAIEGFFYLNNLIKRHMHDEEVILLPLYEQFISPFPSGGAREFFMHEHRLITRSIGFFTKFFSNYQQNKKSDKIDLVSIFDAFYNLKNLLEHHHTREETFLFRLLDDVLETEHLKMIINRMSHGIKN